jgi:hypothetical protein
VAHDSLTERVQAYLDSIPGGLGGHPDAQVKASVLLAWVEQHDVTTLKERLPPPLHMYLDGGFPVSRWVPEVHAMTIYLTLREAFFISDGAFVEDAFERNRALFTRPMYRVLSRMLTAMRLAQGAALFYGQLHRGTTLDIQTGASTWLVSLRHPEFLIPELIGRCLGTAFRAALTLKGATGIDVEKQQSSSTEQVYAITFDSATLG